MARHAKGQCHCRMGRAAAQVPTHGAAIQLPEMGDRLLHKQSVELPQIGNQLVQGAASTHRQQPQPGQ